MKKRILGILGLAAIALLTSCILTGTFVTTVRIVPDDQGDSLYVSFTNISDSEIEVDLTGDADFEDHKDDIKDIDNVGFYLDVTNLDADPSHVDTFQIFIEADTSKNWNEYGMQTIIDSASYLFLTDVIIPGNSRKIITWNESVSKITDLENAMPIIESGLFSLYVLALPRDMFDLRVDSMVVVVTFTAGK